MSVVSPAKYLQLFRASALVPDDEGQVESIKSETPETDWTRAEADDWCHRLKVHICGTDGLDLAQEGQLLLVAPDVVQCLGSWMQGSVKRSVDLWIEFPFEMEDDTSARMAAVSVIYVAATANAPFISHVCGTPNSAEIPQTSSVAKVGLLSLVYSLIRRLSRFRPPNDAFSVDASTMEELRGEDSDWPAALGLLDKLLQHTFVLQHCIIHGLNDLESEDGEGFCRDFLNILLSRRTISHSPFSLLFTTSGQSRVLGDMISSESHVESTGKRLTVERRGEIFDLQL